MPKYVDIAEALFARVRHGDYRLRGFPSHADLVTELGVNSRTVAKALTCLVERGVLVRQQSGSVDVAERDQTRVLHIGVLSPAWPSEGIMNWHRLIFQVASQRHWIVKPLVYSHWHDVTITEALRGLDGLFFISIGDDFPASVLDQIKTALTPVVVLEQDLSMHGVPSLRYWIPGPIGQLVEHLKDRGHRRIACLNTQPDSNVIRSRIQTWRLWSSAHGVAGPLIDEPVPLGENAAMHARRLMGSLLAQDRLDATALVCTTPEVAMAALRAVVDSGRRPGTDIGVCSVEEWAGMAELMTPSLTCLRPPSMVPLLQVCLDYFSQGDKRWLGPLLVEPSTMELFIGESTMGRAAQVGKGSAAAPGSVPGHDG